MPSVVTANRLRSGAVVYLTRDGQWVSSLAAASVAEAPGELARLEALALVARDANEVTAVYAFDVTLVSGRVEPVSVRETIRAAQAL